MKNEVIEYKKTNNLLNDVKTIIETGLQEAYKTAETVAIYTYWNIGRRIVEEEQEGKERAKYGKHIIEILSDELTKTYGDGFGRRNLAYFRKFYVYFPDVSILHTRVQNLGWSHIRRILAVSNPKAREWYIKETSEQNWSVRTLDRNISTQYYGRMMAAQRENLNLPTPDNTKADKLEYIRNPVVAEFLGFKKDSKYEESELEQALIDNLQQFIMELGKGFAFVDRQKHITTETDDFYSDQLFATKYMNYMPTEEELRCEIEKQKQFFLAQHEKNENENAEGVGV